jgi:hypothetical protein
MTERVTVWRAEGQPLADLLADLIALADDPHDVRWEHRGGVVSVPEYLAARYAESVTGDADAEAAAADAVEETADVVPDVPAKRKPGRPRKAAAVTEEVN